MNEKPNLLRNGHPAAAFVAPHNEVSSRHFCKCVVQQNNFEQLIYTQRVTRKSFRQVDAFSSPVMSLNLLWIQQLVS